MRKIEIALILAFSLLLFGCIGGSQPSAQSPGAAQAPSAQIHVQNPSPAQNQPQNGSAQLPMQNQSGSSGQNQMQNQTPQVQQNGSENSGQGPASQNQSAAQGPSGQNETAPANQSSPVQNNSEAQPPIAPVQNITGSADLDPNLGRYSTQRCKIWFDQTEMASGGTEKVNLYAYSPSNEKISFLCGNQEKVQGTGGLYQDFILCDYSGSGITNVWEALDGHVCASAPVYIYTPISEGKPFCQVINYTQTDGTQGLSRSLGATVYVYNLGGNQSLSWKCGDKNFSAPLSELILAKEKTGFIRLTCDYAIDPGYIASIPVSAGGMSCGDLLSQ